MALLCLRVIPAQAGIQERRPATDVMDLDSRQKPAGMTIVGRPTGMTKDSVIPANAGIQERQPATEVKGLDSRLRIAGMADVGRPAGMTGRDYEALGL